MAAGAKKMTPLGIVAASGAAPLALAEYVTGQGRDVLVVVLEGITDADFSAFATSQRRVGAIGSIFADLKQAGVRDVVLSGRFTRPSLAALQPDLRGSKIAAKALMKGDDQALKVLRDEAAKDGLMIIDIAELLPSIMAGEGLLAGPVPSEDAMAAVALGVKLLTATGSFDVGQACVVQGERVLAVEAAEGTDAMIARCKDLIDPALAPAVMVKMLKPHQDPALDPPGMGRVTIDALAAAGVAVLAVQAGGVVILDGDLALTAADKAGVTVIGIPHEEM